MVTKVDENTIKLSGRIDSNNAKQFEDELFAAGANQNTVFAASELEYVSSAGLRVFLKLKKAISGNVKIINVSNDVYDIFDVTGFTNLLDVQKSLREVSIDGCEVIGEGANGKVYRLDEETIIKVFAPGVPLEIVKEERDFAQNAFIAGVPTAISYDVVKCGDSYGAVYEMLNAETVSAVIKKSPERAEEFGTRLGKLLKELHSTQADTKVLTNMLDVYRDRAEKMRKYLTDEETEKLKSVYYALDERTTMLHGDYHAKNVMLMNDELVFIDMGDVGYGHPMLDLGGSYLSMVNIGRTNPAATEHYIGISYDLCLKVWNAMTDEYFGKDKAEEGRKLAEIYGFAKHNLVPFIYTKMTDDMIKGLTERWRASGLISKDYDISAVFNNSIF